MSKEPQTAEEFRKLKGFPLSSKGDIDGFINTDELMEEYATLQVKSHLEKHKEEAKKVITDLGNEAYDLMEFCIDRGYLDNEDLTDGQKLFNKAMKASKEYIDRNR